MKRDSHYNSVVIILEISYLLHSDMPRQLDSLSDWGKLALLLISQTSTPPPTYGNCFPMIVLPLELHTTGGMPS